MPSHNRRRRLALATGVALLSGALAVPAADAATTAAPSGKRLHDDFDGDGRPDLAIGSPEARTGPHQQKIGSVSVLYGASGGLSTSRKQVLTWPTREDDWPRAEYGRDVQSADLDGDGYADLLSSAREYREGLDWGYGILVNWGGPKGLSATPTPLYWTMEWDGRFTVGDVDGDKHPDVVTLVNEFDVDDGYGQVLHGPFTRDGGKAGRSHFTIEPDNFQMADRIAAGDVNGDGVADLAVGAHDGDEPDSRRTALLLGGSTGFAEPVWLKDTAGRRIGGEDLAIGDLDKDGYGEIVVGHSNDGYDSDVELPTKGGALGVVYGGPNGISTTRKPVWINQDTAGVPGAGERGDRMGTALSIGDTDGDGYQDLATGLPGEDLGTLQDAGSVLVLRGGANGLTGTGAKAFSQNTAKVPGTAEIVDCFGMATALVDADGDRKHGLVVGDPAENNGNGSVWVFSTTSGGITANGSFTFGGATVGAPATGARFGAALAD